MTAPLFLRLNALARENWRSAFPDCECYPQLPSNVAAYREALLFLDVDGLSDLKSKTEALANARKSGCKVVVLSPTPSDDEAIACIKMGAVGYGHAYAHPTQLREISLVVSHGGLWVGNSVMKRLLAGLQTHSKGEASSLSLVDEASNVRQSENREHEDANNHLRKVLSERELTVAREVALGATNSEISAKLDITERTVKSHISSIFEKLQVKNRVQLALVFNNVSLKKNSDENPSKRHAP